jgi:predicted nucleic acid-binding protein
VTDWLIDKSALVRLAASRDAAQWAARIERGLVRITTVTRLEVGYSARSGEDLRTGLRKPPLAAHASGNTRRRPSRTVLSRS